MTLFTSSSGNVVATVYIEMSETDRSHPCNHYAGPSTDHTFTCPQNLVGQYVIVERYPLNNKKRILRNCEVIAHGYYLGN